MGYGVLDESNGAPTLVQCGLITAPKDMPSNHRLVQLYSALLEVIEEHKPDQVAIEEPFVHRNVRSAMMIGEAKAIAILAAAHQGIPVAGYAPRQVKQSVTSYGGSDKIQVQEMVRLQLGLDSSPMPLDASDAIAVALCHLQQTSLGRLLAGSVEEQP
jgi:crossover junction endodeoxyribonuclease RuvC